MCFYIFSDEGDVNLDVLEWIWVRPRYYWKPNGKSTIRVELKITAESNDINSVYILYPNFLESIISSQDRSYAISRAFDGYKDILEVLRHIHTSFEILKVSFKDPIKQGSSKDVVFQLDSPNASKIESDYRLFTLNFNISGPDNVKRTFEQGLDGAEKWFKEMIQSSGDAVEKQVYEKLLCAKKSLDNTIVKPLKKHLTTTVRWRICIVIDPSLRGAIVKASVELKDATLDLGNPDVKWPFKSRLDKMRDSLLGERLPTFYSFIYEGKGNEGKGKKEYKYTIGGYAHRNKPTEVYLAVFFAIIMLLCEICL